MVLTWWQLVILMVVTTGCILSIMMLTAQNPSANDFWRGMGNGLVACAGLLAAKLFQKKDGAK